MLPPVEGDIKEQRESFRLLPAYCAALEEQAPGVVVNLVTGGQDRFERIFVCPPVSRATFQPSRRIIASDGTFLKARFILTLLLAAGVDANGETVLLAWAVVESENRDLREWFLRRLQRRLPEMIDNECTFISDRDKGSLEAEAVFGPEMITAWCTQHLKMNFTDKFGRALQSLFWEIACARMEAAYNTAMEKLREEKAAAAEYLEAASPHK